MKILLGNIRELVRNVGEGSENKGIFHFILFFNKIAIGKYLIVSKGKKTCSELGRTVMIVLQEEASWGIVC